MSKREHLLRSIEYDIVSYGNAEARCKKGSRTWKKYHREFLNAHARYEQLVNGGK